MNADNQTENHEEAVPILGHTALRNSGSSLPVLGSATCAADLVGNRATGIAVADD